MSVSIPVVDDEPDVVEMFRQAFGRNRGRASFARLANGMRPALIVILSDIKMPGMDGLSLLREIKRLRPDLPAMMGTAYGDAERRRRAEEAAHFSS